MPWVTIIVSILTGLPSLIKGVEAAFSHQPQSGSQKWIAVETALGAAINSAAAAITASAPSGKAEEVAVEVTKWVKLVNDSTVNLYNTVGWPTS